MRYEVVVSEDNHSFPSKDTNGITSKQLSAQRS